MGTNTAHPDRRRRAVAVLISLAGMLLAGWAVFTLLRGPDVTPARLISGDARGASLPAPATLAGEDLDTTAIPRPARFSAAPPAVVEQSTPVRLHVPAAGVAVPIDAVGVDDAGQMEIPDAGDRAGWFRHGAAPGDGAGSVVLASHVDTRDGPGAFSLLGSAQAGDEVVVDLSDGTSVTYVLREAARVAKSELPVDEIFRRDGPAVLRLVTCAGPWDLAASSYTDNVVLTAHRTEGASG